MSNSSANLTPNFPCCYKGSNISSPSRAQMGWAQITVGAPPSPVSVWGGGKNAARLKQMLLFVTGNQSDYCLFARAQT